MQLRKHARSGSPTLELLQETDSAYHADNTKTPSMLIKRYSSVDVQGSDGIAMSVESTTTSPTIRLLRHDKGSGSSSVNQHAFFDPPQHGVVDEDESTDFVGSSGSGPMKRARCQRASRAARASDPSSDATTVAYNHMYRQYQDIRSSGVERAPIQDVAFKTFKPAPGSGGKGAAVKTSQANQAKMNHLAALKAKDIDTNNTEPAFLLGGFTAPLLWDRLAENSLKSNAVNSSVMNRRKTQGAANQTTRISCKSIGQAASAQVCAVALSAARARHSLRSTGIAVVNPLATNSVNLCALNLANLKETDSSTYFSITSTSRLVYNACPVKLSAVSVLSVCIDLARRELEEFFVSNAMGTRSECLVDICRSLLGEKDLDAVWCSWVMINYLASHPRGRDILEESGLTDIDVQSAIAFERYGGEEIRRRLRQLRNESQKPRKRGRGACASNSGRNAESALVWKRRRTTRRHTPSVSSDCHAMLEFWHQALQSTEVSVLHTLASHSKQTARDAALSTLARQSIGSDIGDNVVLQNVSLQNALKSAKALVSFVGRRVDDIPSFVVVSAQEVTSGETKNCLGMLRIDMEAASSSLHACVLPPVEVRPSASTRIAIAWSHASKKLLPTTDQSAFVPGILERYHEIMKVNKGDDVTGAGVYLSSARAIRETSMMENFVDTESEMALTQDLSGTTRSFLSISTFMSVNHTHERVSTSMVAEARQLMAHFTDGEVSKHKYPLLLGKSQRNEMRREPLCTPSSPLAIGICANEMMRCWMSCKTRKNDPCKKHLGFSSSSELSRDMPGIASSEPLPMLTITDVEMESTGCPRFNNPWLGKVPVSLGIHVCGDGATRVPELLTRLRSHIKDDVEYMKQARAAVLVASSQASYIGVVASSLVSGYTNASVASSKKITCPDVNKLMLLSAYDCYAAGLCNIQRSFENTAYSGTYGCRIDTGFTMHGLFAHNYRSDKRQHGNCALSQEAADELAIEFGKKHWVVYDDPVAKQNGSTSVPRYYTSVPIATRGIPHNYIPGVHSLTKDYCSFIESYREMTDRTANDTVDSIMCLHFSPWSQALPPDLEPTADVSLKTCFREQLENSVASGRAYLPDSTSENDAIVKEPLFRRPCQVSSGDCPFATAYESVDTFFNCCNALALLARSYAGCTDCLDAFHVNITRFVNGDHEMTPWDACWAADALVLLNVLYPTTLEIGELALLKAFAKAAPACQQSVRGGVALTLDNVPGLDAVDVRHAKLFWSSFCRKEERKCAWKWGLKPLLHTILDNDGSHNTTDEIIADFKIGLECAVQAVWLVYSEDGVKPPPSYHPASSANSPRCVCRHHIDPLFVGNSATGVKQRASSIGLKPHTYRQVVSELLGAAIPGVECNVAINEGGLGLRVSSDPTILDEDGKERTDKSISPVQTEGDENAYGSREQKIKGAVAQKVAWDTNALLTKPLFTAIEAPMHPSKRSLGEFGCSQYFLAENARMAKEGQRMSSVLSAAKEMLVEASNPRVARVVNNSL